ncbi:hypothetical protein CDEST_05687 [Colletotrichum destructivum]|uniref:Uncharacterized protein n=1 Tax=Colletotrichum destructivum TaxID=34406 RepID=A0AAX4IBD3_9PEZI|nr:hypothetical protein CDEST_05687 [Colletotrichum destructivum]
MKSFTQALFIYLFAVASVQAACTLETPGTEGFEGGNCRAGRTKCQSDSGGASILCCDDSSCK